MFREMPDLKLAASANSRDEPPGGGSVRVCTVRQEATHVSLQMLRSVWVLLDTRLGGLL